MGRTNNIKKVSAILCGDFHLRLDTPVCRIDNFPAEVWKKVDFISALAKQHDCPVLHSGDLFNHWKPSPELLSLAIKHLPGLRGTNNHPSFNTIYGNHDLPQHNLELSNKCGIHVLSKAGKITVTSGTHWGLIPENLGTSLQPYYNLFGKRDFLMWHVMTYKKDLPWPGCTDSNAKKILKKYPQYDLILTGHNHKTFVEKYKGRLLVNPGSIFRMSADQENHKPCVFLYYADTNTVEPVYLPITPAKDCISREHIEGKEERDNRIEAFVSRLDGDWETTMSFEENLERFYGSNKVKKGVKEIIQNSID